jgi:hypothetical protein
LESSLKQLANDSIFISVAAGNSFLTYNTAGLSYPAVSSSVTPVASVDASGNLSRFSQRNQNVLAAPGEKIMSTLPDAFYGSDGNKNDWGAASGTSMASPYVAGASVLVREAMQDLGYTQITQGTIDDLFHRTADKVFDSVTNATYDKIQKSPSFPTPQRHLLRATPLNRATTPRHRESPMTHHPAPSLARPRQPSTLRAHPSTRPGEGARVRAVTWNAVPSTISPNPRSQAPSVTSVPIWWIAICRRRGATRVWTARCWLTAATPNVTAAATASMIARGVTADLVRLVRLPRTELTSRRPADHG